MMIFLAFPTLFFVIVNGDLLEKYANAPGNVYHGRYTRDIREPEFLVPRRVLEDGSFSTYSLPNFYDRREISERGKRSLGTADKLHLVLPFNGIDHHVELSPYHEFISPDMVVETRGAGIRTNLDEGLRFRRASDRQCHYRGAVRGHDNSRAALSLCDGVAGYVQTNHGRYFIEPVYQAEPEADGRHIHVAYKRNAPFEKTSDASSKRHCGTSDNWESAWAEQLAKRQKRLMENNSLNVKRDNPYTPGTHSIHRYIEIGLVADRRFLDFHNRTDYEQYLLTVMNMVSDFYHDKSVGNQIDAVLVRMIYLEKEKEEIDLLISPAAEDTLESFSKWAEKMNPKDDKHPNHFDIAVLVTRYDICSEETNCDLMGLAHVAAACDSAKAACINEDSGLLLGIVIAHEVGHVMGCSHDKPEISGCPSMDTDDSYFIMSPIVFLYTIRWSSCSRKFITAFLESGLGECLTDNPRNPPEKLKYPDMLPGAMYDATYQCQMTFPDSQECPQPQVSGCERLWCLTNSSCYSKGAPKADGTKCGENKWCIHKKCVDMGTRPAAVHGGWGDWGPLGPCTRTCGGGLKYSERECDRPVPANGGRYCIGERKKLFTCNTTPCDPTKPPYRAMQCSEHDNEEILTDGLHQWKPYMNPKLEPCALYCINEKHTYVKISPTANDSTPCKPGTNYMCISGTCRKVGCDWVIDSDAIEDKCGVCKGDGTTCSPVEGEYTETVKSSAYVKIVTIPRGARSIHVFERKPSENILAVMLTKNKTYCINADNREFKSGDYECAGTMIIYTHPEPDKEVVEMKGPISEDIEIQYVFFKPQDNPGINYKYYVMSTNTSYTPKYMWDFVEWSECSAKCDGGTMISEASCIEEQGGRVTPNFCDGIPRPEPKSRICNQTPCPAKWRVSQWSKCNACDGKKGVRRRKVQCVRPSARPGEDDVQANLNACKGRVPKQKEECIGTRPCRTMCPKKTRQSNAQELTDAKERANLSSDDWRKMIDRLVDVGLAHYLDKSRDKVRDDKLEGTSADRDFRRHLYDWAMTNEDKRKRTCVADERFTTMKPGSIIKDSVPIERIVVLEAPYMDESLQSNLSDKAFHEAGDRVGVGIDTSQQKIYKGAQAIKLIEQLAHRDSTTRTTRITSTTKSDDRGASIDVASEESR
ncbi:A disintegrin and metalloproteinase with thrombospondin motifs 7-like isoform X2 [Pseudomyrmex gracilis]|uniref:A disintegrin and metalloproteinase with thrombospondin motifs 7-like isoform X2 n=1 Tax=Pseudomyrmex gracilis TaxID=219809 RepID=UPI000995A537|nr:A disintegrin and metalloproteinase with thrombospondin motifs 7-like isoform X2 [Pseudomyrmex gracilis]